MIIVFTACAIMAGSCREFQLPMSEQIAMPMQCAIAGQSIVAEWQREHASSYRLSGGFVCTTPERLGRAV